jgi:hypothetical protein
MLENIVLWRVSKIIQAANWAVLSGRQTNKLSEQVPTEYYSIGAGCQKVPKKTHRSIKLLSIVLFP